MAFDISFDEYMKDVYSQLECNASDEYKKECIVFTYSVKEISNLIEYFKSCYDNNISAYKALTLL